MTKFRPCIDLHDGQVKQIVGASLRDTGIGPVENFVAEHDSAWFGQRYQTDGLTGGHVIKLGPGNETAATAALQSYPDGLQIGGGINASNAADWLKRGASHIIVTSWLFDDSGRFLTDRLDRLVSEIGSNKIVIDLSCKRDGAGWTVAMNRWQTLTELKITESTLDFLSDHCDEFLIHSADVEGLCQGIDVELVTMMGDWGKIPMTYAGGVANMADVELVASASNQNVDVTVGSALDLFGGRGIGYRELVTWNQNRP